MRSAQGEKTADASEPRGPVERVLVDTSLLKVTVFAGGSGPRFHGDLDACTRGHAAAAVAEAAEGGGREAYLDLAGLDFCGTEGLRLFVGTAQRLGWQGRELVLCSAAPLLVRLLEILGWADVPGMVVVPRRPAAAPAGLRPAHARRLRPEPALTLRSA